MTNMFEVSPCTMILPEVQDHDLGNEFVLYIRDPRPPQAIPQQNTAIQLSFGDRFMPTGRTCYTTGRSCGPVGDLNPEP